MKLFSYTFLKKNFHYAELARNATLRSAVRDDEFDARWEVLATCAALAGDIDIVLVPGPGYRWHCGE